MFRYLLLALVVCSTATTAAVACINEYGTPTSGSRTLRSHVHVPPVIPIDSQRYREQVEMLTVKTKSSPSHEDLSDLAVAHLYLGEIDRSIELLLQAESLVPGEYAIASNLGTAFELAGRNEEALHWIEEGIRRNPQSHGGSEWIHANLLKAKIAIAADSEWLTSHSVSGLRFGEDPVPEYDTMQSLPNCPESLSEVRSHLEHQLYERRSFIPGADPIVAALMFDLANAIALIYTVEDAIPIYMAADELGFHNQALIKRRISALEHLQSRNVLSGWSYQSLGLAAICLVLTVVVVGVVYTRSSIMPRAKNNVSG